MMIYEFNLTLLGKQLWWLVQFPYSLLAIILRGNYFRCSSPLGLNKAANPSYGWTSIMVAKPLISLGIRQKVHSGNEIRTCKNFWLPMIPSRPSRPIAPMVHPNVSCKWTNNMKSKKMDHWVARKIYQSGGHSTDPIFGHKSRIPSGCILLELYIECNVYC